jgi:hypothetical protein
MCLDQLGCRRRSRNLETPARAAHLHYLSRTSSRRSLPFAFVGAGLTDLQCDYLRFVFLRCSPGRAHSG